MLRSPASRVLVVHADTKSVRNDGGAASAWCNTSHRPVISFATGMPQHKDVVCHEFVHAMVMQEAGSVLSARPQPNGQYVIDHDSEAKALDEGLADYFAYAYTERARFGEGTGSERNLDQGSHPVKLPWCNGYSGQRKGYQAAPAISGALFDLRQAIDPGSAGAPGRDEFDRWIFDAVVDLRHVPVDERTALRLRQNLESAPLAGRLWASEVGSAFEPHNIKVPHDNTCRPAIGLSAVRSVTEGMQTIALSWSAAPGAQHYRVYLEYWESGGIGMGGGTLLVDRLADTAFVYVDPDTGARVVLTVVPVDSTGNEGTASSALADAQRISLGIGWNLISANVTPSNCSMSATFGRLGSAVVVKNGRGQVYWPALGIDQIGCWSSCDAYLVRMPGPATLSLTGSPITLASHGCDLGSGWSHIPYLPSTPMAITTALNTLEGRIVIVKNGAGQVYWPALGINQIGSMQPGQGYQINLSAPGSLIYPTIDPPIADAGGGRLTPWKEPTDLSGPAHPGAPSALSATLGLESLEAAGIGRGDVIGVQDTSGRQIGSSVVEGSTAALTVWGDDPSTIEQREGLGQGEPFRIVVHSSSGVTGPLDLTWTHGRATFDVNAILRARANRSANLTTTLVLDPPQPNPSRVSTVFRYGAPVAGRIRLTVFSVDGRRVRALVDDWRPAGLSSVIWDHLDQLGRRAAPGIYFCQIEQNGRRLSRRLLLIR